MKSLEEIKSLFGILDHPIQGLNRIPGIIDLFVFYRQSLERIPDEELGFRLKGGGELFKKVLDAVLLIGQDINDGGLR